VDGANHRGNLLLRRQARGIEHIRPRFLVGLQPLDGVGDIAPPDDVVLRPRGQRERERQRPRHRAAARTRATASAWSYIGWSRLVVESSIEPPASPTAAARRMVSATVSGSSPKPFSRSALTGRSVAATISATWAIILSRPTVLSRCPMANA